jgi:hypothetical protein
LLEVAGVGVGSEHLSSAAAGLEGSNEHFDAHRGPIQVLMPTLMEASGRPIVLSVYLASLLKSGNNLKIAYQTMYSVSIFLPLLVALFRLKMQDGCSSRRASSRKRYVSWKLVFREY